MSRSEPHPVLSSGTAAVLCRGHAVLTAAVWSNLAALYAFAVTAAVLVGKWPSYGRPDPKDLELTTFYFAVFLSFHASLFAGILWLVVLPFFAFVLGASARRMFLLCGAGLMLSIANFVLDPLGVVNWFFD